MATISQEALEQFYSDLTDSLSAIVADYQNLNINSTHINNLWALYAACLASKHELKTILAYIETTPTLSGLYSLFCGELIDGTDPIATAADEKDFTELVILLEKYCLPAKYVEQDEPLVTIKEINDTEELLDTNELYDRMQDFEKIIEDTYNLCSNQTTQKTSKRKPKNEQTQSLDKLESNKYSSLCRTNVELSEQLKELSKGGPAKSK